jgi:hypothetical protein
MKTSGIIEPNTIRATTRLVETVEAANTLLYHAIASGQDLPMSVRDPIIKARTAMEHERCLDDDEEGKFLEAYAKLGVRVAPVTAATLDATRRRASQGWLRRLLRLPPAPVSDAQRLASRFGALALCLIAVIAFGEWTHAFIRSIAAAEKQFAANKQELREAETRRASIEDQIGRLTGADGAAADTANAGAIGEALRARRAEIDAKIWALDYTNGQLNEAVERGYDTLERMLYLGPEKLRNVSMSFANILGGVLLPVLYGALGTCAFVLRSLFREMVDRTFDARRAGEFKVRIFLGTLSGLSLQWLVVRSDGTVAGGVTPAVLAFLGGYSVEMLFTAMDRLVHVVAGRFRASHRNPLATRGRQEQPDSGRPTSRRTQPGEHPTNGAATTAPNGRMASRVAIHRAMRGAPSAN